MNANSGKIVTFYSFKGGVGRTMALANVAFIAAMNGMRVLVMDWDLEAPGLSYYFRGLLDPQQAKTVKDAKGILNIFTDWVDIVRNGESNQINTAFDKYTDGTSFADCVVPLVPRQYLSFGASLDYISAGSKKINSTNPILYEDALATFSWQNFFDAYAGGAILQGMRNWCKQHYDLVLIDSRTGLADVAGICTMQLPDEVILCFALNRQNIDGVSKIAHAIRHTRKEQVKLHAIPMRTSRTGTPEESDARARALSELTRIGGFSLESLQEDFSLSVRATDGIPFYETLASLLPKSPEIEVFATNYRQLASVISGQELTLHDLAPEWKEAVRRRMQLRHATIDYVQELQNAEPMRASEEIGRLLEGALEMALDEGELDDAYVVALTEAAFVSPVEFDSNGQETWLGEMAVDLLRALHATDRGKWAVAFVDGIERYWYNSGYALEVEQQVALLEEADTVLADSNTLASQLRRLDFRRMIAKAQAQAGYSEQSFQQIKEARGLSRTIKQKYDLAGDQAEFISLIEMDLHRLEGDMQSQDGNNDAAIVAYRDSLKTADRVTMDASRPEALRQKTLVSARLSRLLLQKDLIDEAVSQAIAAAESGGKLRNYIAAVFQTICDPIIAAGNPSIAATFCTYALLQDPRVATTIATNSARSPKTAIELFSKLSELVRLVTASDDIAKNHILDSLSSIGRSTLANLSKRRSIISGHQQRSISKSAEELIGALGEVSDPHRDAEAWRDALASLSRIGNGARHSGSD